MRKKTLFVRWILVIFIAFSFSGCSDNDEKEHKKQNTSFINKIESNATITFYFPDFPIGLRYKEVFDEVASRAKKQFGIQLVFKKSTPVIASDYTKSAYPFETEEIKNKFDVAVTYVNFVEFAKKDYLFDISKLLPEHVPQLYFKLSKDELQQISYDGGIYAIPSRFGGSQRLCAVVRDDLVEKYKITDINTLDDYEVLLDAINNDYKGDSCFSWMDNFDFDLLPQIFDYGVIRGLFVYKLDDPSLRLIPFEQTDEYRQLYSLFTRWQEKGFRLWKVPKIDYLLQPVREKRLMSFLTSWDKAQQFLRDINGMQGYTYTVFPMYKEKVAPRTAIGDEPLFVINKNSRNPELALKIIEWMLTDQEVNDLLIFGIKDKDYSVINNRIKLLDHDSVERYFGWHYKRVFYDMDNFRELINDPPDYIDKLRNEVENNTQYLPTAGFHPNFDMYDISYERELLLGSFWSFEYEGSEAMDYIINIQKQVYDIDNLCLDVQRQLNSWRRMNQRTEN